MDKINFQGNFISHVNIKKIGEFNPLYKAAAVEINPFEPKDLHALWEVKELWEDASFSGCIYKDAAAINNIGIPDEYSKFFVITRQRNNFERLNADEILAEGKVILGMPHKNAVYLDYLQVEPDNCYESCTRVFKGVGTAFINFIKNTCKNKEIRLRSLNSTVPFYEKNKFRHVDSYSNELYFKA